MKKKDLTPAAQKDDKEKKNTENAEKQTPDPGSGVNQSQQSDAVAREKTLLKQHLGLGGSIEEKTNEIDALEEIIGTKEGSVIFLRGVTEPISRVDRRRGHKEILPRKERKVARAKITKIEEELVADNAKLYQLNEELDDLLDVMKEKAKEDKLKNRSLSKRYLNKNKGWIKQRVIELIKKENKKR